MDIDPQHLPGLRIEPVGIDIALCREIPGHLDRCRQFLRLGTGFVRFDFHSRRRLREVNRHGIRRTGRTRQAVSKPAHLTLGRTGGLTRSEHASIGGSGDRNLQHLQRFAAGRLERAGLTVGQTAAVKRDLCGGSRENRAWQHEIDVRAVRDRQPVKVIGPASVDRVVQPQDVFAISRGGEVEQRILPVVAADGDQFLPGRVEQVHDGSHPRVHPPRTAVENHAFARFQSHFVEVEVGSAIRTAVDHRIHRHNLRLGEVIVRLGFGDFRTIAHDERPRIRQPKHPGDPHIVGPDRQIGGDGHRELVGHGLTVRVFLGDCSQGRVRKDQSPGLIEVGSVGQRHVDGRSALTARGLQRIQPRLRQKLGLSGPGEAENRSRDPTGDQNRGHSAGAMGSQSHCVHSLGPIDRGSPRKPARLWLVMRQLALPVHCFLGENQTVRQIRRMHDRHPIRRACSRLAVL